MSLSKNSNQLETNHTQYSPKSVYSAKKLSLLLSVAVIAVTVYLAQDYKGSLEINLQDANAWGLSCQVAEDLLVQEFDSEGNLWATRGMVAYKLSKDGSKFIRQYHIPTGFSIFWLRNFSFIRRLTKRPECVELIPMSNGEACAMSAGRMWYRAGDGKNFKETLKLSHYGISTGQGVRNDGLVRLQNGSILLGEYFINKERTFVRIYHSQNNGKTWQVAYTFQPGQIRHIHAVQQDPYTDKVWVCTGDFDKEPMVAWTDDAFKSLNIIGQGSQIWRVCQLVFTEEAVFWGTDTGKADVSGIYRWDRKTHELTKLSRVAGEMFYATRLAEGTIVMSTARDGARNEKDDKTRLWTIMEGGEKISSITGGRWDYRKKYAKLRFQRDQGGSSLFVTVLDQKEFDDGDLVVISEEDLRAAADRVASKSSS